MQMFQFQTSSTATELTANRRVSDVGTEQRNYIVSPGFSCERGTFDLLVVVPGEESTYVFAGNGRGEIADYQELEKVPGTVSHVEALRLIGFVEDLDSDDGSEHLIGVGVAEQIDPVEDQEPIDQVKDLEPLGFVGDPEPIDPVEDPEPFERDDYEEPHDFVDAAAPLDQDDPAEPPFFGEKPEPGGFVVTSEILDRVEASSGYLDSAEQVEPLDLADPVEHPKFGPPAYLLDAGAEPVDSDEDQAPLDAS